MREVKIRERERERRERERMWKKAEVAGLSCLSTREPNVHHKPFFLVMEADLPAVDTKQARASDFRGMQNSMRVITGNRNESMGTKT